LPERTAPTKKNKEQVACHNGRQYKRQVAYAVEEEFETKIFSGEQPAQCDGKGQADHNAQEAYAER
jgi:hypothetical protein